MFEVRVQDDFAAAHFLRDYNGKCENLHGHNYKVYVHVEGNALDAGGMLIDFTFLKRSLKEVLSKIDHTNLNDIKEFDQNPSAERIATFIFNQLIELVKKENIDLSFAPEKKEPWLWAVDVFETETSRARYSVC